MRILRMWPWWLLLAITFLALFPWSPQGPLDARTYSVVTGVHLEYPWSSVFMEPLLALGHMVVEAPNFRLAFLSFAVWIVGVVFLAGILTGHGWSRLLRGFSWAAIAVVALMLYTLFIALVPLPGCKLTVDDPNVIVADLHSHTLGSHDGLITADENLRWHQERGYQVVVISEHKFPAGSFSAQELAQQHPELPGVIPGVEVRTDDDEYMLGLGISPSKKVMLQSNENGADYERDFINYVHGEGGAVVALSWLLEPWHVDRLAAFGINGIELANTGHPDVPDNVHAELLKVSAHGVPMIASTDWHGWGGITRVWTLVRVPGSASLNNQAKARAVLEVLKSGDQRSITPIEADYIGPPSLLREIFAPAVEFARYASDLTLARVLSWWVWIIAILVMARWLRLRGFRPWRLSAGAVSILFGSALSWRAAQLLSAEVNGAPHEYAREIGTYAISFAVVAFVTGAWLLWNKRSSKMPIITPLPLSVPVTAPLTNSEPAVLTLDSVVAQDAAA